MMSKNTFSLLFWTGVTGVSLAALVAYTTLVVGPKVVDGTNLYVSGEAKDVYIVVERDGKRELHKGDIEELRSLSDIGKHAYGSSDLTRKVFYCGEETISNEKYYVYQIRPDENAYDVECEECMH